MGREKMGTVVNARYRRHDGLAHLPGAGADGGALHRQQHRQAGGIAVLIGGDPGVPLCLRTTTRQTGYRAPDRVETQPDGQGRQQRIARDSVAASGGRQHHRGTRGTGQIEQGHNRRDAKRRDGVGHHGHRHGQAGGIGDGSVGVGVRNRPGQEDGRGRAGGRAAQGTRAGGVGQTLRQDRRHQRIDGVTIATSGSGKHHRPNGDADNIAPGGQRRDAKHGRVVGIVEDGHRYAAPRGDAPVAAHRVVDDSRPGQTVGVHRGGDGDGLPHIPVRGGETQGTGDGHGTSLLHVRRHRHVAGGDGVQPHGVRDLPAFLNGEGDRNHHPGPARHDADGKAAEKAGAVRRIINLANGIASERGLTEREGCRRRHGRAEHLAETPARRDGGTARVPGGRSPGDHEVKRGGLPETRLRPAVAPLGHIKRQHDRIVGVAVQTQLSQESHTIEQPLGQGAEPVVAQIQGAQLGHPGKEARGDRANLVVAEKHGQNRRPPQPVHESSGQGGQRIVPQVQEGQFVQPGEEVFGQGGKPRVAQKQQVQLEEAGEVATLQSANVPAIQVNPVHPAQVGRGQLRAVVRGHGLHNGITHQRVAATDVGRLHGQGERETGGVAVEVGGDQGVGAHRRECRRAGYRAGGRRETQPGGQHALQRVDQRPVAAGDGRQNQGINGGARRVDTERETRHAETRPAAGLHGHREGQTRLVAGRGVGVGIRDRPGQYRARGDGRRPGEGARGHRQDQPRGNGGGGGQGIGQGAVPAGRGRQGQRRNRHALDVELGGEGLRERRGVIHPVVVHNHDDDRGACGHLAVAADRMGEGGGVVRGVGVMLREHGDRLEEVPGGEGKGQGRGDGERGAGDGRRHRHRAGGGSVEHDGIGGLGPFGHDMREGGDEDFGPGRHDVQPEAAVVAAGRQPGVEGMRGEPGGTERDRHRRRRGGAEHPAGPPAGRDKDGARCPTRNRPRHRDGQRCGLRDAHPCPAIAFLYDRHGQHQRRARVAVQAQTIQAGGQPVKQTIGQGGEPVVVQSHTLQGRQSAEDARGQGGEPVIDQGQPSQAIQPGEQALGQGGQPGEDERQPLQRPQPVKQARGQDGQGVPAQAQHTQCRYPLEQVLR